MRRRAPPRGPASPTSNLFPSGKPRPSCGLTDWDASAVASDVVVVMAVPSVAGFAKNGNEHGRDVLQEILRLGLVEVGRVLAKFVRDLIDDEAAAGRCAVVGL